MNNYMNYQKMQVTTVDRLKLVVMLYEGAISYLKTATQYLEKNDLAGKGMYIAKAQDIIDELNNSLNMKDGGEIAVNLRKIYNFLYFYLVKANLSKNRKMLDEVINILSSLKEAWEQINISETAAEQPNTLPQPEQKLDMSELRV
jgi:flagellar protein FliS